MVKVQCIEVKVHESSIEQVIKHNVLQKNTMYSKDPIHCLPVNQFQLLNWEPEKKTVIIEKLIFLFSKYLITVCQLYDTARMVVQGQLVEPVDS